MMLSLAVGRGHARRGRLGAAAPRACWPIARPACRWRTISARFHNALAELALAVARRAGGPQVVLSGGCFQNALLGDRVRRRLSQAGFSVYTHRRVPPGDGGIALGQVWVAVNTT